MSRREYSDEEKAAVLAALLSGQGVKEVAKEYKIPEGTIHSWKSRLGNISELASEKKEAIGDLLVTYLARNLETLEKQAEVLGDPEYLRKDGVDKLAIAHGIMTDKAVRLLEALGGKKKSEPEE